MSIKYSTDDMFTNMNYNDFFSSTTTRKPRIDRDSTDKDCDVFIGFDKLKDFVN